jgi:hypothetical protein
MVVPGRDLKLSALAVVKGGVLWRTVTETA